MRRSLSVRVFAVAVSPIVTREDLYKPHSKSLRYFVFVVNSSKRQHPDQTVWNTIHKWFDVPFIENWQDLIY